MNLTQADKEVLAGQGYQILREDPLNNEVMVRGPDGSTGSIKVDALITQFGLGGEEIDFPKLRGRELANDIQEISKPSPPANFGEVGAAYDSLFKDLKQGASVLADPQTLGGETGAVVSDVLQSIGVKPNDTPKDIAQKVTEVKKNPEILEKKQIAKKAYNAIHGDRKPQKAELPAKTPSLVEQVKTTTKTKEYGVPGADDNLMQGLYYSMFNLEDAQTSKLKEDASFMAEKAREISEYNKEINEQEENRQKILADRKRYVTTGIEKLNKSIEAMRVDPIDPDRYFKNASTGKKIFSALGVFLGGIGSAFTGQPNAAMEIISKAIDDDINAQIENARANRQLRQDKLNANITLLDVNRQMFGDELTAIDATKAQYYSNVKSKLAQLAATSQSKQLRLKADELSAQLDLQIEQRKVDAQNRLHENSLKEITEERIKMPAPTVDNSKISYRNRYGVDLGPIASKNEKVAEELNKQAKLTAKISDSIDEMLDLRMKSRGGSGRSFGLSDEDKARQKVGETIATDLGLVFKEYRKLGTLDKDSIVMMNKLVPSDPTAIFTRDASIEAQLKTLKKLVNDELDISLQQEGIFDQGQRNNRSGQVQTFTPAK